MQPAANGLPPRPPPRPPPIALPPPTLPSAAAALPFPLPLPVAGLQRIVSAPAPGGLTSPPPASAATAPLLDDVAIAPSTDEVQLQAMVSALRTALGKRDGTAATLERQLVELDARLQACNAEKRQMELGLLRWQASAAAAGPCGEAGVVEAMHQELAVEAARAMKAAAERDRLQLELDALSCQLDASAKAEAQERERLCQESAQSRLLARARARQLEHLAAQLQQLGAKQDAAVREAGQEVDAARATMAVANQDAAAAQSRADEAETALKRLRQEQASLEQATVAADKK